MAEPIAATELSAQSCTPCRGGMPPLTPAEAVTAKAAVPDWTLDENATAIERRFAFRTYADSLAFVQRVSAIAEAENHHPDIGFGWGYASVTLRTHAIKGLHRNDFIMAAKIDQLLATS